MISFFPTAHGMIFILLGYFTAKRRFRSVSCFAPCQEPKGRKRLWFKRNNQPTNMVLPSNWRCRRKFELVEVSILRYCFLWHSVSLLFIIQVGWSYIIDFLYRSLSTVRSRAPPAQVIFILYTRCLILKKFGVFPQVYLTPFYFERTQ